MDANGKPVPSAPILGFIASCYPLGSVFGVPIAPWFNQRFGRRWSVMGGSLIMIVGALLQGFSQNGKLSVLDEFPVFETDFYQVGMYIFARMVLGFGIVFCIIAGSSLIGELAHPNDRPALTSFFNSSYYLGAIIASAVSLGTTDIPSDWSWRVPSLLQMAPSVIQIVFIL